MIVITVHFHNVTLKVHVALDFKLEFVCMGHWFVKQKFPTFHRKFSKPYKQTLKLGNDLGNGLFATSYTSKQIERS